MFFLAPHQLLKSTEPTISTVYLIKTFCDEFVSLNNAVLNAGTCCIMRGEFGSKKEFCSIILCYM